MLESQLEDRKRRRKKKIMMTVRLIVYSGALLVLVVMLLSLRSTELSKTLGGAFEQLKNKGQIAVSVEKLVEERQLDGVPAEAGWKYVRLRLTITSKEEEEEVALNRRCFQLVDSRETKHKALAASPLFKARGTSFDLKPGEEIRSELVFSIPLMAKASHLHFRR
jgi:flagellar basal body-associated protein FliL